MCSGKANPSHVEGSKWTAEAAKEEKRRAKERRDKRGRPESFQHLSPMTNPFDIR